MSLPNALSYNAYSEENFRQNLLPKLVGFRLVFGRDRMIFNNHSLFVHKPCNSDIREDAKITRWSRALTILLSRHYIRVNFSEGLRSLILFVLEKLSPSFQLADLRMERFSVFIFHCLGPSWRKLKLSPFERCSYSSLPKSSATPR